MIDGPQARFRVYGNVSAVYPEDLRSPFDLAHVFAGGHVEFTSDQHFGVGSNLILPGRGKDMGDGWETKRSRQIGHKDWAIIKLYVFVAYFSAARRFLIRDKVAPREFWSTSYLILHISKGISQRAAKFMHYAPRIALIGEYKRIRVRNGRWFFRAHHWAHIMNTTSNSLTSLG